MTVFRSLRARVLAAAGLVVLVVASLGGLLLQGSDRANAAFHWVNHTQDVILSVDALGADLGQAESGLRGYLLTGDTAYLARYQRNLNDADRLSRYVAALVVDNPAQYARARRLRTLTVAKSALMSTTIDEAKRRGASSAAIPMQRAYGKRLMDEIIGLTDRVRDDERSLLDVRMARANDKTEEVRALVAIGCPILALLIVAMAWMIRNSIARPIADLLDAVTRFGHGDRGARAATDASSTELRKLSHAYNDMADRLGRAMADQSVAESQLAGANATLVERGRALETRQHSIELLSEMSHRLQAIQNEGELADVLDCFLPKVLPNQAGCLYIHNHSRNMLVRTVRWGEPLAAPETFVPSDCWGLRRGKPHVVDVPGADLLCAHAAGDWAVERRCEPVLAGGEVLGMFYLEGQCAGECAFRLGMLMENVALALVNENLRARLREQSIRDPLTKLFNRRYMEEALDIERARAVRGGGPLSVIMADIDHFKRFNDGLGHEAGDALLRAVAGLIQAQFRHGDIVCRYGGEEFTVIAPGTTSAQIRGRVEALRLAVRELTVEHNGARIGPVTMSFGIDTWSPGDRRPPETLIGDADRALFRAKRLGRDRIELGSEESFVQAAE